jgi:CheY-like chemotaxis protein
MRILGYQASIEIDSKIDDVTKKKWDSDLNINVLLVEDNRVNQKLALHLLRKRGCAVTLAENGEIALQELEKNAFDIVLMDVQMPVMDGIEATRIIREREQNTGIHIPIIAMTAHALKGDKEKCLDAGMDGYVSKPIKFAELYREIGRLIPPETISNNSRSSKSDNLRSVSNDAVPFDFENVLDKIEGDYELFSKLANIFVTESSKNLSQIKTAISNDDSATLERSAHALKGAAGNFDAKSVVAIAEELEQKGKNKDIHGAENQYAILEKETINLISYLESMAIKSNQNDVSP